MRDNGSGRFAARVSGMAGNAIGRQFGVAARDLVSLGAGLPATEALPIEGLRRIFGEVLDRSGPAALQYGGAHGVPALRERICDVMRIEGIEAGPDQVVVTVGSQQALDLLTRILIDPGDVVFVESPAYAGALGTFAGYQAEVVHVPGDGDGLLPDALRSAVRRVRAAGKRPKLLYTVPNFANPSGVTTSERRRTEVLDLCRRTGLLVVEDNPYGLLRFEGSDIPPMRAMDADTVIYLGTFSKTLAPALRVGWAVAPAGIAEKLVMAAETSMLCHSYFAQFAVAEYLARQPWADEVKLLRTLYASRRDAMLDALGTHLPEGCSWTRPEGGFFVWLTLPDGLDAAAMLPDALRAGVSYVPGTGFFADGSGAPHARLAFSQPPESRITEGIARLATVVRSARRCE